jgi:hypothetical protein
MSTVLCQLTPFNLPAKKHLLIRSSLLWLRASTTRDMPGTFKNPQQPDSRQTVRGWSISSFPVINNCFPFSTCPACHPLPCVEPGHAAATVRGEQIRRGLGWVGLVVGPLPSTTGCSRSAGGGLWREKIAGENDQVLRTNGGLKASFSYACLFPKGKK